MGFYHVDSVIRIFRLGAPLGSVQTVTYRSDTIRFRGPQVWATNPQFTKDSTG